MTHSMEEELDTACLSLLVQFSHACASARNEVEVSAVVERATASLGFERFAMVSMPLAHEKLENHFMLNGWPRDWFDWYVDRGYFGQDPVVNAVRRADRAIIWSEEIGDKTLSAAARTIMQEAASVGLVDGVTIPVFTPFGFSGLLSMGGRHMPAQVKTQSSPYRYILQIIAMSAYSRLCDLRRSLVPRPREITLTHRESECLAWCAAGMTDRQIADITCRSPRTVQTHLTHIQQKLGVSNRAALIAEAFRHGLQR